MYRVAVTCPEDHPVSPGATFAYRLGRIEPGVHNHELHTGKTTPIEEFVSGLVEQALAEFPGHQVGVERIVANDDGESHRWIPAEEFDPEQHTAADPGEQKSVEIHVAADQQTAGGN